MAHYVAHGTQTLLVEPFEVYPKSHLALHVCVPVEESDYKKLGLGLSQHERQTSLLALF